MGFSFVLARFGLFLQQLQMTERIPSKASYRLSLWFGTALITVGVAVNAFAGWHHIRLARELEHGEISYSRPSRQAVAIAFFLAVVGIAFLSRRLVGEMGHPTGFSSKRRDVLDQRCLDRERDIRCGSHCKCAAPLFHNPDRVTLGLCCVEQLRVTVALAIAHVRYRERRRIRCSNRTANPSARDDRSRRN